jgi:hypothetical protein
MMFERHHDLGSCRFLGVVPLSADQVAAGNLGREQLTRYDVLVTCTGISAVVVLSR